MKQNAAEYGELTLRVYVLAPAGLSATLLEAGFAFINGLDAEVEQARSAARNKDVQMMGAAETVRHALAAGLVDELTVIVHRRGEHALGSGGSRHAYA